MAKKRSIEVSVAKFVSILSSRKLEKRGCCPSARRRNIVDESAVHNFALRVIRVPFESGPYIIRCDIREYLQRSAPIWCENGGRRTIVDCPVRGNEERHTGMASSYVSPARGNQTPFQRRHGIPAPENSERVSHSQDRRALARCPKDPHK